jgi:hypothetical protein
MKKLLGILVLGLLLSGNAYADKKFLVCSSDNKVIEKGVKEFLTSINLDDNFLMINNKKFNITSVNDEEIKAVLEIKKKNSEYFNRTRTSIWLNRFTGLMDYKIQNYKRNNQGSIENLKTYDHIKFNCKPKKKMI